MTVAILDRAAAELAFKTDFIAWMKQGIVLFNELKEQGRGWLPQELAKRQSELSDIVEKAKLAGIRNMRIEELKHIARDEALTP